MNTIASSVTSIGYRYLLKPILFQFDPEGVHTGMVNLGEMLGRCFCSRSLMRALFSYQNDVLNQTLHGINFSNPIGLAAGFDYNAKLTQILPVVGFGFGSVGTITFSSYQGNTKPILGRLPKSRSLMVNKGFKNEGAETVITKLAKLRFNYPVGISIGRTNTLSLKTQKDSIKDIVKTFILFEESKVNHAYYELNISCPNLFGNISFYPPKNLKELLKEIAGLKLKKPIFIKMPIEESDKEILAMLDVITKFPIQAVIIGNLQKNKEDPALDPAEVAKFTQGYFSGKPTWTRSNELIKIAYKNFGKKLTIIGCGGVFSAEDAYTKIKLGATLIQLITGMIYQGPSLIGQMNYGLVKLLKQDGFKHVSEAVGVEVN